MRLVLFLLVLCCAARLAAADLTAVRIWPGYRTAESFERMSEFFDGKENVGGETMLRSQPASREGFYFLTRLQNTGPTITGIHVELSVIVPNKPEPKIFTLFPTFEVPTSAHIPNIDLSKRGKTLSSERYAGSYVFQIGLTGTDWPDATAQPVAWQLRLLNAEGQELLREQSYLWTLPPK